MGKSKAKVPTPATRKLIQRRETKFLPEGDYCFRDQLLVEGTVTASVLTARGWLLERFDLAAGAVMFTSGTRIIEPRSRTFWAFYPSFTLSRISLRNARGAVTGKAGIQPGPVEHLFPFIFESNASLERDSIEKILAAASNRQSIDANPHASSLSIKARHLIAETYTDNPSIARVAARLAVTNAHLSRQFRRDYGLSPREYLHQLRIADATLQLARGDSIADVSGDSGYGDLSRFYKQFRKTTRVPPGVCRGIVAPERA
jgi:AraC-like DNA-binding protein